MATEPGKLAWYDLSDQCAYWVVKDLRFLHGVK